MKTANAGENWVYLNGQIAKGAQPHSVLIHEVGKHLTGEPALGMVANTWLAGNALPKGLDQNVARGHYDKQGRPAIWESNVDRNHVMDAAYAALESLDQGTPITAAHGYRETAEEMYAKIQGLGWDVLSQGPKHDLYSVTIRSADGAQIERTGKTQEQAMASALTWAWQHSKMSKTANDEPTGRYIITNSFGHLVSDKASSAGEAMDWAEEMANMGEPGDNFQVYDMVEKKPIAAFHTDEADRHKNFEEHTSAHIKDEMDLPIPTQTLGQVMSMLRPNVLDGNHLGLQAHKLGYSFGDLQTVLRLEEAEGVQPGWKGFKEAALTAYASRGWQVQSALKLVLWNALTGQKGGPSVNTLEEGQAIAEKQMQNRTTDGQQIIYRAQVIDPTFNIVKWDTDEDWDEFKTEDWARIKGDKNKSGWEPGKVIPIQRSEQVPVNNDWTFTSSEEAKPDYMFVYYQGALEVEDYSPNTHSFDMLKRILDLAGKDVTDQNVDDNKMSSGEITKRDGEIDVELTNLADNDVQTAALDSVHEWARGMNLVGPIQPRLDG